MSNTYLRYKNISNYGAWILCLICWGSYMYGILWILNVGNKLQENIIHIVLFFIGSILLLGVIIYKLRKKLFQRIQINEEGIKYVYKNEIFREISWNNIKQISVISYGTSCKLFFTNNEIELKNYNIRKGLSSDVYLNLKVKDIKFLKIYFELYKDKIVFKFHGRLPSNLKKYLSPYNKYEV